MISYLIKTNVANSNPARCDVYSIQSFVIKFVIDIRLVGDFLRFYPPIKLTATVINIITSGVQRHNT